MSHSLPTTISPNQPASASDLQCGCDRLTNPALSFYYQRLKEAIASSTYFSATAKYFCNTAKLRYPAIFGIPCKCTPTLDICGRTVRQNEWCRESLKSYSSRSA
ncbi:MAG: hypothetical protein AAGD25_01515 [Cyanobacteria bacterium P01_F01_bin.150]